MKISSARRLSILLPAFFAFSVTSVVPLFADATTTGHHKNFAQRHPNLTSAGVGVGTYAALKIDAARKKRRHQKLNFADRHPMLTGAGAAIVTHHIIKKSTPKN